jgi:hypothetical protein
MNDFVSEVVSIAQAIQLEIPKLGTPPDEGYISLTHQVLPFSVVRNSRGYIERIVNQINGTFERGWYDSCAVMIRRLVETVIVEAFEHHRIANKIKDSSGNFLYLGDLVSNALAEQKWNLSRNTKKALPRLKDIGDKSAHSRRFIAHRSDIDRIIDDLRVVVQEFIYIANLK